MRYLLKLICLGSLATLIGMIVIILVVAGMDAGVAFIFTGMGMTLVIGAMGALLIAVVLGALRSTLARRMFLGLMVCFMLIGSVVIYGLATTTFHGPIPLSSIEEESGIPLYIELTGCLLAFLVPQIFMIYYLTRKM